MSFGKSSKRSFFSVREVAGLDDGGCVAGDVLGGMTLGMGW